MSFHGAKPDFISRDVTKGKYLFLDMDPPRGSSLVLVGAGREICTSEYRIERSGFEYHAIEFVVAGTWKLAHQGIVRDVRPGGIFAYGPDTSYSLRPDQDGDLIKYFLNLAGNCVAERIAQCGLSNCEVLQARDPRWIRELFDQLLGCDELLPERAREIGQHLVELILLRIGCDVLLGDERGHAGRESFARCRAFIHDHFLEVGTVAEVAARCHVDPSYLARLFKSHAGERPLQLLNRLKTQHAADLILRRRYSVKAAAEAVGFPDPYHFSRVFKRIHGVSPVRILRRPGGGAGS